MFSKSRKHILGTFICFKIDDTIAHNVCDQKLMEIGLVYGDILLYRQLFPGKATSQKSYEERKDELKKKLKRTHNFGKNKEKRQIS